jgi:hypothetical protein
MTHTSLSVRLTTYVTSAEAEAMEGVLTERRIQARRDAVSTLDATPSRFLREAVLYYLDAIKKQPNKL